MDNPNNRLITKSEVENILNYFENIGDNGERLKINNLEHFQRAFVHESYYQSIQNAIINNDFKGAPCSTYIPCESNERLEYLGDHVLKAVLGRYLFQRFDGEREGFMTKLKIKIEKCSMLHQFGVTLGFKKFLLLSLQVENQTILDMFRGRATPAYYEDAFEAFIGAISVEFGVQGYIYADRFVRSIIENVIDFAEIISTNDNFKDSLQRYFQSQNSSGGKWKTPVYISLNEEGPLYRKVFTRMLPFSNEQMQEMDKSVQEKIKAYTKMVMDEYKRTSPQIYSKLYNIQIAGNWILGVGHARKVTAAEQACAKQCMDIIGLQQDY